MPFLSPILLPTATALAAAALALAQGPCAMPDCLPVMDASACYNAIILGWEGASTDPADIFKCVDDPALMCACYGCTTGLDELVTENELCPPPAGGEGGER